MLTLRDVESHKKRPFVKYLMNAYMKTMEPAERSTSTLALADAVAPTNSLSLSLSLNVTPATASLPSPTPSDTQGAHATAEFPHDPLLWDFIELLRDEADQLAQFLAGAKHQTVYYMLYNLYPKRSALQSFEYLYYTRTYEYICFPLMFVLLVLTRLSAHNECTICFNHPSEFDSDYYILK